MPTDNSDTLPMPSDEFRMIVEDTFTIEGRGLVVAGRLESGSVRIGQDVRLSSPDGLEVYETKVKGIDHISSIGNIEIFLNRNSKKATLLLPDLTKEQVKVGMLITLAE
jgi:translation elongation factor EF-Tu-like GTPase